MTRKERSELNRATYAAQMAAKAEAEAPNPRSDSRKRKVLRKTAEEEWTPNLPLPHELHEQFVRELIRVRSVWLAYYRATMQVCDHPTTKKDTCRHEGYRFMRDPRTHARLSHLREELMREIVVTGKTIAAELEQAIELAAEAEDPDTMIKGIMAKAKVFGLGEGANGIEPLTPVTSVRVKIEDRSR